MTNVVILVFLSVCFVIISGLVILSVGLAVKVKHSKPEYLEKINKHVRRGSSRIRNTLRSSFSRRNEVASQSSISQSFQNRSV